MDELLWAKDNLLRERGLKFEFYNLLTALVIGSSVSILWEMMLWLSVSLSCIRCSKSHKVRPKMCLAAGLCPDPLGELERYPRPSSCNWGEVPTSNGKEKGKRKGREGEGRHASHTILGPENNGLKNGFIRVNVDNCKPVSYC